MVLRKSFYIHWSDRRSPRVHEVNQGRDPSTTLKDLIIIFNDANIVHCNLLKFV